MTFLQNRIEINCFLTDHHRLIAALHGFTARLYGRLHGQSGNIAVSPFSVASALAMLVAGTSGSTRQGLKTTIGYEDDDATLHAGMSSLITLLKAPADGEATHALETANALWLQAGWIPGKPFAALVENHYETSLRAVDFQNDAGSAVDFINSWADTHTRGRISSLISSLLPSTRLVVANTVWLKCGWEKSLNRGAQNPALSRLPLATSSCHLCIKRRIAVASGSRMASWRCWIVLEAIPSSWWCRIRLVSFDPSKRR